MILKSWNTNQLNAKKIKIDIPLGSLIRVLEYCLVLYQTPMFFDVFVVMMSTIEEIRGVELLNEPRMNLKSYWQGFY